MRFFDEKSPKIKNFEVGQLLFKIFFIFLTTNVERFTKTFFVQFRSFEKKTCVVEQECCFLATFFSSACKIGRMQNRPKFFCARSANILESYQKNFGTCVTNTQKNMCGPWRGKKTRVFSPPYKFQSWFRKKWRNAFLSPISCKGTVLQLKSLSNYHDDFI